MHSLFFKILISNLLGPILIGIGGDGEKRKSAKFGLCTIDQNGGPAAIPAEFWRQFGWGSSRPRQTASEDPP